MNFFNLALSILLAIKLSNAGDTFVAKNSKLYDANNNEFLIRG